MTRTTTVYRCPCGEDVFDGDRFCWCGRETDPTAFEVVEIADIVSEELPRADPRA